MKEREQFTIRSMTQNELESIAIEWAAKEGWNPGLHDAPCFYAADPEGFFVGLLNDEPIACISAVAYDEKFAFIGFYIVAPEYRGKGYGLELWRTAIAKLQNQNIGLDGVVEQQHNYKKSGFELAYNNIRYEVRAKQSNEQYPGIVKLSEVNFEDIVQYDTDLFPVPRPKFLHCWVNQSQSTALVALQHNKVIGYGVIRKCRAGYKIGPLFADAPAIAKKLFVSLSNATEPGAPIYLDTPEINQDAVQLAQNYDMHEVFRTARMYTKGPPEMDMNRMFGVTTFELG
jgi:ribosomal protein S18 acetylase RimI-like enzyme